MSVNLSNLEFQLFKHYIHEKCAIDIPDDKAFLVESRLSGLLAESGLGTFNALYNLIVSNTEPSIAEKLIDAITTHETLWFRDRSPWLIMERKLIPEWIAQLEKGEKTRIRIWSAAASTGQEAYSTAMCIDHYLQQNGIRGIRLDQFEIRATDISRSVLEIARRGRYDAVSIMRGMDPVYKERYFTKDKSVWVVDERIRSVVRFEQFNLQNSFWGLGCFDLVFCRYVLIYFADAFKSVLFQKLSECLLPTGVLFLGASEFYSLLEPFFILQQSLDGSYYTQRREP